MLSMLMALFVGGSCVCGGVELIRHALREWKKYGFDDGTGVVGFGLAVVMFVLGVAIATSLT